MGSPPDLSWDIDVVCREIKRHNFTCASDRRTFIERRLAETKAQRWPGKKFPGARVGSNEANRKLRIAAYEQVLGSMAQ